MKKSLALGAVLLFSGLAALCDIASESSDTIESVNGYSVFTDAATSGSVLNKRQLPIVNAAPAASQVLSSSQENWGSMIENDANLKSAIFLVKENSPNLSLAKVLELIASSNVK